MKKSIFLTSYAGYQFTFLSERYWSYLALSCCLCRFSPEEDLCLVKHTHDDWRCWNNDSGSLLLLDLETIRSIEVIDRPIYLHPIIEER